MKKKYIAFGLNFLLPGAGFAYLRRWKLAALNLVGALTTAGVLGMLLPEAMFEGFSNSITMGIAGGSGAWALYVAEKMSMEANATPTMEELSDEADLR